MKKIKTNLSEKTITCSGNFKDRLDSLIEDKLNFKVSRTNRTTKISVTDPKLIFRNKPLVLYSYLYRQLADKETGGHFFALMSELKKMIRDNHDAVKKAQYSKNPYDIKYYAFHRKIIDNIRLDTGSFYTFKNVYEADITKAYYRTALNLGFITDKFYKKCLGLKKSDRLRLIGSIATVKITTYYEKGIMIEELTEVDQDELLRDAWFKICSYVSEAMQLLKNVLGNRFIFYWVDGIYFEDYKKEEQEPGLIDWGMKNNIQFIEKVLKEKYNFEWKLTKMEQVLLTNKEGVLEFQITDKKGKKRVFYPPKEKIKYYGVTEYENFDF